ncbi:MAG: hypothetical protein ACOVOD_05895, partial [Rhodoferax sp.]
MSLGFLDLLAATTRAPTKAKVAVARSAVNANMGIMLARCHNSLMPSDAISTARVRIQPQPFDVAQEIAALQAGDPRVGAV